MTGSTRNEKDHTRINPEIDANSVAKSKKELRLERKAAKKAAAAAAVKAKENADSEKNEKEGGHHRLDKEEYLALKKQRRAELRKEQEKAMRNQLREEKKLRKRKKLNRELNAKGGAENAKKKKQKTANAGTNDAASNNDNNNNKKNKKSKEERDANMNAFRSVFHGGSSSENGGMVTTRLGVQYKDTVVGTGKATREGVPITVKYELTGGKFGAVLDSSKKFTFRLGMGEVIRGWDIGLLGMREGGRRKLIVPPKAGYGGKDIGAGPGAPLNFDITLLSCGR